MSLTQKQKENISKYLFDISKLSFGGLVVGGFLKGEVVPLWELLIGFLFSTFAFILVVILGK